METFKSSLSFLKCHLPVLCPKANVLSLHKYAELDVQTSEYPWIA